MRRPGVLVLSPWILLLLVAGSSCGVPGGDQPLAGSLAAPQFEYWVPMSGHAPGGAGTNWRTDLGLYTGASATANVQVRFFGVTPQPVMNVTVAAGRYVVITDVVDQMHVSAFGPLQVVSDQPLVVTSRTYTDQAGVGTMGQDLEGFNITGMMTAGGTAVVTQLTENAAFRSNVGILNAGAATANVRVELVDGSTGTNVATFTTGVPPASTVAYSRIFFDKAQMTNLASGFVRVTLLDGGPIVAYGSVLDNVTNDPTTVPMKRIPLVTAGALRYWLPTAGHLPGEGTTKWRTDLALLNLSGATANVTFRMYAAGGPYTRSESIPAGRQVIYRDVVDLLHFSGMAPLEINSDRALIATSRTYTENSDLTTIGQDLDSALVTAGLGTNETAIVPHLAETSKYRSNLGVCNSGAATAAIAVSLFDGTTGNQVGSFTDSVPAGGLVSYSRVFSTKGGVSSLAVGYAKVTVTTGSGVIAYGSVLDNATNDPTTMPMRVPVVWGGAPLTGQELVDNAVDVLGTFGTTLPGFEVLVPLSITFGPGALADLLVTLDPTHATKTANGARVDFGSGVTFDDGLTRSGVVTLTWSNVVQTATRGTGDFSIVLEGYAVDGRPVPDMTVTGSIDANTRANGTVYGDLTASGVAKAAPDSTLFKGSAHFDTATCQPFPSTATKFYFRELAKIATYALGACAGNYTRTEAAAPAAPAPYPAQSTTVSPWSMTGCGDQFFMNDWKVTIDGAGNVSLALVQNLANVQLSGGGTVRPNSDRMTSGDPQYFWSVPFTYTYTAVGGGPSYAISGRFNGTSYDGTLTVGSCSVTQKNLAVTWH